MGRRAIKVSCLTGEPLHSACSVIRVLGPLGKLKGELSLDIPERGEEGRSFARNDGFFRSDIILLQRTLLPGVSIGEWRSPWRKIVYEIDDYLLEIPKYNPHSAISREWRDGILSALKGADAVTVTTPKLKERLEPHNGNVHVLPNYIDLEIWGGERATPAREGKPVVIGWIGTPTHKNDIDRLAPAIQRVVRRYGKDVVFRFWGCVTEKLSRIPQVECMEGLIPDYREYAAYLRKIDIDIALAPLEKNPFNECKSNIKYLEYSVCGIPGIYSRIAPYEDAVEDGRTGLLCDADPGAWHDAMVRLIEDEGLRKAVGENARADVLENHTLERNAGKWLELYAGLAERNIPIPALCAAKSGGSSLKVEGADGSLRTLHSLYSPESEAADQVDGFRFDGKGIIVALGLGLGYHVAGLARRYPDASIVAVEMLPRIHEMAMAQGALSGVEDRVGFIVGYPPKAAISEITMRHLEAGMPPLAVFPFPSETAAFPGYYGEIRDALDRAVSFRLWDRLRYPKLRAERLTIALFDFGYFLTEEIARATEALGHRVVRVRGGKEDPGGEIVGRAVETIASERPDFFLTVNHFGFDEGGQLADLFRSIEMPAAVWYVDSPDIVVKAFPRNASPYCTVFVWDRGYMKSMKSLGFENVAYLPLAADETLFRPGGVAPAERRKNAADVGFAGNSMAGMARERLLQVRRELRPAVERTAQRLAAARDMLFAEAADISLHEDEREMFDALKEADRSVFESAALRRATLLYRLSRLRALEEFRPFVRGDAGWKGLLNGKFRLGPPLNYYAELPAFYKACKVNFNATSAQMGSAVNQRVFDVPACGAFLLTDRRPALEELFEVGEEVIAYADIDEIDDLARFYLRNDAAREAVAAKGRSRVLREHTYRHRLGEIVRRLRELYG